jgi:hypothetical protein
VPKKEFVVPTNPRSLHIRSVLELGVAGLGVMMFLPGAANVRPVNDSPANLAGVSPKTTVIAKVDLAAVGANTDSISGSSQNWVTPVMLDQQTAAAAH